MAMHHAAESEVQRGRKQKSRPCHAWNPMSRLRCKQCHAMNPDLQAGREHEVSE
jgi:hypothetical protein